MNNKNEEDFFDKYTCIDNPFTENGNYENRIFEGYIDNWEEDTAIKIAIENNTIWTLIDSDGWFGVVAGWHYINRCGYFVTEEPYESIKEQYTFYDTTELCEQWEKLPREAIEKVTKTSTHDLSEDEYETYIIDTFYIWKELGEEGRSKIINQYGIL